MSSEHVRASAHSPVTVDVLMVTDCRFPGGNTSSVVEEIRAQSRAGYRTGLLHVPSPVLRAPRPFATKIREVLEEGSAELVVGAPSVQASLLLARHPTVFLDPPGDLPELHADQVLLAVNQVPVDERGEAPYYDVADVQRTIERVVGKPATWAPIGPRVREALADAPDHVPVLPWDWENVIDVEHWRVPRGDFVSDRPVIGRHSRGHWTKWPDNETDILAAYPDDERYSVRVLGGAESPAQILGHTPANWVVHPFNSMPAREFLASIDFFVYFHHPGLIEAFGRVVLEALSAGAVAIVPEYLKPLFGDACLYGNPGDVRGYVDELYGDWQAFAELSRAGIDLASRRFSYETHAKRVADLIGSPRSDVARPDPGPAPAPAARRHGTLVVDLSGEPTSNEAAGRALEGVVNQAVTGGEPCTVALPAQRANNLQTDGGIETLPRVVQKLSPPERQRYLIWRLGTLTRAHRPNRLLVLDDGTVDLPSVLANVGGPELTVLVIRQGEPGPAGGDEAFAARVAASLPDGWTACAPPPPRVAETAPARRRGSRQWELPPALRLRSRARRKLRTLRRDRLARLMAKAPETGLMLFEAAEAEWSLPVPARITHPSPEQLPVALIVVTGQEADPAASLRAIVQRKQVTSSFRLALLVPVGWEPEAAAYGVTTETLLTEQAWAAQYGTGWAEYVRGRVAEACEAIQPHTVAFAEDPAGVAGAAPVLEVLEAARVRRRKEGRHR